MKMTGLCVFALIVSISACGGSSKKAESATSNSNSSNVSFGPYDLAQSGPAGIAGQGAATNTTIDTRPAEIKNTLSVARDKIAPLNDAEKSQQPINNSDRKVIRNAELNLESDSPETAQQKITDIAESKGGFVVESQQSSSDIRSTSRDTVSITIRVPSARFSEALNEVRAVASRVIVETVKGEDVTEEFIDIEARLKAKKALEAQFMEIMKRTNSVGEALSVQSQLADVRGDIEKIEGRKRFLENQASLSSIKIRIQAPAAISANSTGLIYRFTDSFNTGFDFAVNFLLGLLTFAVAILPFAILIGLPAFLVIRYGWKRSVRPRSVSEIAKEEISG